MEEVCEKLQILLCAEKSVSVDKSKSVDELKDVDDMMKDKTADIPEAESGIEMCTPSKDATENDITAGMVDNKMNIILAGIGMGASKGLTGEVSDAIESADILLGAKRLIEPYKPRMEKKPYYLGKDIVPYLESMFLQSAGKR